MDQQKREIRAWHQTKLHNFILVESRKATSVNRNDHRIMLRMLVAEAWRNDPCREINREMWRGVVRALEQECKSAASIMSIAPDPYNAALAKLSSMMLWTDDEGVRQWQYRYNDAELARRKANQAATLAALQAQGGYFLESAAEK